jgi:diketogulonate reductase-like aldo/keto reductase
MTPRPFGPLATQVVPIGQGTWNIEKDRKNAVGALRKGIELGLTHIDTAEMYANGRVEEIVGEALSTEPSLRDRCFLVSKVLPQNASFAKTIESCEKSLKRLKTDHLDVYLLHWPAPHPLEETLRAFEELVKTGKTRAYGVSNFDERALERAVRLAGDRKIVCNQVLYHIEERGIEHAVIPACEKHNVAVVGYSPFGQGSFPTVRSSGGKVLAEIGLAHGATPHAVALSFLLRRPSTFVIPKSIGHVEDNAKALDVELTAEEIQQIEYSFPRGPKPRELVTS